ncbi:MAG TPA: hypothetical protein VH301_00460, partial [Usitatibacter sp.]|nr:hypothetical protein [Usitatibacter sp.]
MIWLFIVGGVVLGAVVNGFAGALALGFVGWVVGMIVKSLRTPIAPVAKAKVPAAAAPTTIESLG